MRATLRRPSAAEAPVVALLRELLVRITQDIPGALGAAITVRRGGARVCVVATEGISEYLVPAQIELFGGPVATAFDTDEPVLTDDLFTDRRWPELTLAAVTDHCPTLVEQWSRVAGAVALPGCWEHPGDLVLSTMLDRTPTEATLGALARYERLVAVTLAVIEASTSGATEQIVGQLQSRAVIEQAKGAIVGLRRCTPDEAWNVLCHASQGFNVKLRELAVALIEHLGDAPAPLPAGMAAIIPSPSAREAAELLWTALSAVA